MEQLRRLAVALVALTFCAAAAAHDEARPRLLTVGGEGEVEVAPDRADVSFAVEASEKNLADAEKIVSAGVARLLKLCESLGVPKSAVRSAQLNVHPQYDSGVVSSRPRIVGYMVSRQVDVDLRDLSKLGKLLQGAVESAANRVSGVAFGSSKKDEHQRAALALAAQDARANAEVLASASLYGGTARFVRDVLPRFGFRGRVIPVPDLARVAALAGERTRVVVLESPTNPMVEVVDIAAVAKAAHDRGLAVFVDNTFATPIVQQPLKLGADLVMHSLSKALGGHSDVIGGALVGSKARIDKAHALLKVLGGCMDPHTAFLVERGLKTVHLRVQPDGANLIGRDPGGRPQRADGLRDGRQPDFSGLFGP